MTTKKCSKCSSEKLLIEFNIDRKAKSGYTSNCKVCVNAYSKAYREANKEKAKLTSKRYYEENKDKIAARRKQYRQDNKEALAKYRKDNIERYTAHGAARRARKLNATPHWLSEDEKKWIKWMYAQAKRLEEKTGVHHHVDHIIPLKHPKVCGIHTPYNLQILTAEENKKKSNSWPVEDEEN